MNLPFNLQSANVYYCPFNRMKNEIQLTNLFMKPGFISRQKMVNPLRGVWFNTMSPTIPARQNEAKMYNAALLACGFGVLSSTVRGRCMRPQSIAMSGLHSSSDLTCLSELDISFQCPSKMIQTITILSSSMNSPGLAYSVAIHRNDIPDFRWLKKAKEPMYGTAQDTDVWRQNTFALFIQSFPVIHSSTVLHKQAQCLLSLQCTKHLEVI